MDPPEVRYTRTRDGVRIAYGLYGGVMGEPLVLIPYPSSGTMNWWHLLHSGTAYAEALSSGRPIARVDFRGTGFSKPEPEELTLEHQVLDLEAVLEALGRPVEVAGWSAASFPMVSLATRRPELFRRMLLIGPSVRGDLAESAVPVADALWGALPEIHFRKAMMRLTYDVPDADVSFLARLWIEGTSEAMGAKFITVARTADVSEELKRVDVPTAVVGFPQAAGASEAVARLIPGSSYHLADGQHRVNAVVGTWHRRILDSLPDRGGGGADSAPPVHGSNGHTPLTRRQREILRELARGSSNALIASDLGISPKTVERHVADIYAELGVHNRAEATAWAYRNGLA